MTENDTELDRYREAFATLAEDAGATEGCPDTETIYRAVSGELSAAEVAEIVDHLSECASCAQAWTVARQMAPAAVESTEPSLGPDASARDRRGASPWTWMGLAAAAVLAVALGVRVWQPEVPTVARSDEEGVVHSLLDESAPLSRNSFVLRWSGAPEGSRYRVSLTTEDLRPIARAEDLAAPEYRVDPESLSDVPRGTRLLWRIETALPDGELVPSPTFVAIVD
jgi:hypothetical protein